VLTISRVLLDQVVAHARADYPDEACGVIAGPEDSENPERFIAMTNAARSPTFYEFDSTEQGVVWAEMRRRKEDPVVIYHSHTATEAYPSRTDISHAGFPEAHYLLVSVADPDTEEIRSFRIIGGEVTEEDIQVSHSAE
jgi:proteasome lid subunit RPN8/RPN11